MQKIIEEVEETYVKKAWKAFFEMRFGRKVGIEGQRL